MLRKVFITALILLTKTFLKGVCAWVFLLHRIVKVGYVASRCFLIFVVKPGDLHKHTLKLNKIISDHQVLLCRSNLSYVPRCFSSCALECILSSAASEMCLWSQGSRAAGTCVRQRNNGAGPKEASLGQESHLSSCSGNSKGLVVCYSCAIGATFEELEPLFILKATTGSLCTNV